MFFSIIDQFANTSHFVSEGQLISLQEADGKFELRGNSIISKLFCGFANWIGHLLSDMSGSSGSKGRGMGIPSPLWCWTNDIIAIKSKLKIPVLEFDKSVNDLALQIYEKGFDARFQTTQGIPVFINELVVRLMYSIRRFVKYITTTKAEERSFSLLWKTCEPFSSVTVKRMLTIAHGTFCLIDVGDAVIRGFITGGGYFNVVEFFLRLNIVGIGRLTISLYGEMTRTIKKEAFDRIRNVPSDKKLEYDELKKIRLNWKQQAEKIEKDYNVAQAKQAGAGAAGAGLGVAVVAMGPTVAMGVATTFGVASTGTAISSLSGAAATNAALAWLGGGAIAAGGGGMAAGEAVLALAGPIGWAIAAASLVASGLLIWKKIVDKNHLNDIFIARWNRSKPEKQIR